MNGDLNALLGDFITSYAAKPANVSDYDWLMSRLKISLPDKSGSELKEICDAVMNSLKRHDEVSKSLEQAKSRGMSREHWLAAQIKKITKDMSGAEAAEYMRNIQEALSGIEAKISGKSQPAKNLYSSGDWDDDAIGGVSVGISSISDNIGVSTIINYDEPQNFDLKKLDLNLENKAGVKAAVAGALVTASESGKIAEIPAGTPPEELADIANISVENTDILISVSSGELSPEEGIERAGDIVAETVEVQSERFENAARGFEIGQTIGRVLGPAGVTIGGCIGAAVGYVYGAEINAAIQKGRKKFIDYARKNFINPLVKGIKGWVGNKLKAGVARA
ncbi:MAG: hypothetical protein IJ576_08905 [Synergistaceae bacterium]|nr:hypothetical protein [Synergistaceae bacterium]